MKIPAGLSRSSRVLLLAVPLVLSACSAPETLLREKQIAHGNREKVEAGVFDQAIEAEEPDAVSDPKEVWRARRKRLLAMEQWQCLESWLCARAPRHGPLPFTGVNKAMITESVSSARSVAGARDRR